MRGSVFSSGHVFHISMIRCDQDQAIVPYLHESAQDLIERLHKTNCLVHLLLMSGIITCPVFEQGKIILFSKRTQLASRLSRVHDRRIEKSQHGAPALAGEISRESASGK